MLVLGTDWATISSLATAGGTLVLAVASDDKVAASIPTTSITRQSAMRTARIR